MIKLLAMFKSVKIRGGLEGSDVATTISFSLKLWSKGDQMP